MVHVGHVPKHALFVLVDLFSYFIAFSVIWFIYYKIHLFLGDEIELSNFV